MRGIFIFFSVFFFMCPLFAQDVTLLIKEAEKLEAVPNEAAAFHKYREILKLHPANVFSLIRCSELCSRIGKRQRDNKHRDDYYEAAKIYAEGAVKLDPANSDANCVMAIALGRTALTKSGKEKIATAKEIKRYIDISLKSNPQNYKAWHVLGKWNYEISNLGFIERTAAKILFGGMPPASMQDAIVAFEKVRSIAPWFILNYIEMAKAYKVAGQKNKAVLAINEMYLQKNSSEDDPFIKEEGKKLLKEL